MGFIFSGSPPQNKRIAIGGQSNAVGLALRSDLSASPLSSDAGLATFDSGTFSRVYIFNPGSGNYEQLKMGTNNQGNDSSSFGPEFGLAVRWMRETTRGKLFIDKFAVGNQAISYYESGGSFFTTALSYKTTQDAWFVSNGIKAKHAGWLWAQGESDYTGGAGIYLSYLTPLVTDRISNGLMTATEPRVIAQMLAGTAMYGANVDADKVAYQAANPTTTSLITFVNHFNVDNLHLNGQGQLQQGYDAYEKIFNAAHITT